MEAIKEFFVAIFNLIVMIFKTTIPDQISEWCKRSLDFCISLIRQLLDMFVN